MLPILRMQGCATATRNLDLRHPGRRDGSQSKRVQQQKAARTVEQGFAKTRGSPVWRKHKQLLRSQLTQRFSEAAMSRMQCFLAPTSSNQDGLCQLLELENRATQGIAGALMVPSLLR